MVGTHFASTSLGLCWSAVVRPHDERILSQYEDEYTLDKHDVRGSIQDFDHKLASRRTTLRAKKQQYRSSQEELRVASGKRRGAGL